ncbi:MAG: hypothetical protein ACTSX9_07925 [Candidatus Njordarchaeales archaeon]
MLSRELRKYISTIIEPCGEGRNLVVMLKPSTKNTVIEKVTSRLEEIIVQTKVMTKGYYRGIEITIYSSGKLLLKNVRSREIGERILAELLQ